MRWVPLTALVFIFSTAIAAPVPKHLIKEEPLWPTAVGTKWVYDEGGHERVEEISKAESVTGAVRLTLTGPHGERTLDVTPDVVIQRTSGEFAWDVEIVRLPLKEGATWTFAITPQKGLEYQTGKMTVGETKEVKVPAGKFLATKVVCVSEEANGKPLVPPRVSTYWYARGVGVVKSEWDGGGKVLKTFIPGKK